MSRFTDHWQRRDLSARRYVYSCQCLEGVLRHGGHGLAHLKARLKLFFEHHDAGKDAPAAALVDLLADERTARVVEQLLDT